MALARRQEQARVRRSEMASRPHLLWVAGAAALGSAMALTMLLLQAIHVLNDRADNVTADVQAPRAVNALTRLLTSSMSLARAITSDLSLLLGLVMTAVVILGSVLAWRLVSGRGHARWFGVALAAIATTMALAWPGTLLIVSAVLGVVACAISLLPASSTYYRRHRDARIRDAQRRLGIN